jgi:hypothetical protein
LRRRTGTGGRPGSADLEGVEHERAGRSVVALGMQVIARLSAIDGVLHVSSVGDDAELE